MLQNFNLNHKHSAIPEVSVSAAAGGRAPSPPPRLVGGNHSPIAPGSSPAAPEQRQRGELSTCYAARRQTLRLLPAWAAADRRPTCASPGTGTAGSPGCGWLTWWFPQRAGPVPAPPAPPLGGSRPHWGSVCALGVRSRFGQSSPGWGTGLVQPRPAHLPSSPPFRDICHETPSQPAAPFRGSLRVLLPPPGLPVRALGLPSAGGCTLPPVKSALSPPCGFPRRRKLCRPGGHEHALLFLQKATVPGPR